MNPWTTLALRMSAATELWTTLVVEARCCAAVEVGADSVSDIGVVLASEWAAWRALVVATVVVLLAGAVGGAEAPTTATAERTS